MKTALVTGASLGIGRACCEEFAKKGVNVVINYYKHESKALELKEKLEEEYQIKALAIKCDVSNEEEVENMVNTVIDTFGSIDILVNNAGISKDSLMFDKSIKDFKRVLEVNLIGTFLCSKYVGKIMKEVKKGTIINISSANAIDTYYPESFDYDASKAGVISLTHNLAKELSPFVRVNCLALGWVKTPMNKNLSIEQINKEKEKILLKRFAEAEEIAKVVIFLASSKASYINDSIIRVDGGKDNG